MMKPAQLIEELETAHGAQLIKSLTVKDTPHVRYIYVDFLEQTSREQRLLIRDRVQYCYQLDVTLANNAEYLVVQIPHSKLL